jgi:glucose-fructose oxidoreductase
MESSRHNRRDFLMRALAGGALLGCASGSQGGSNSMTPASGAAPASSRPRASAPKQLGVALLGLGDYSESQLAPSLRLTRHCALRGIVTGTPAKIERWQKEYGIADRNVYDYTSLPRIADNSDIDVVYVVVPTALHAKYAILAAEAGKHVWCEKPMAMTVEECQRMIDACRANRVALAIGYRMQHEPNTRTIMNRLRVEAQRGWYELEPMQKYEGVQGKTSDGKKLDTKVDKQQSRQMDDDALAILERRPLIAPGEEGRRDIRIVQAILQAAQSNVPVTI